MLLKIVAITLVIIWCIVIFLLSNMTGKESGEKSQQIVSKIFKKITHNRIKIKTLEKLNRILRKCMHATEFCILGILIFLCLRTFEVHNWKLPVISIVLSFLYACSDEFHQKFIDGRCCRFKDVLIDTAGAFIGVLILSIFIN